MLVIHSGKLAVQDKEEVLQSGHAVVFEPSEAEEQYLNLVAHADGTRFILLAGQPMNEPIVQHGPFVLNTQAELEQTMEDYYMEKNGFEGAKKWKSEIRNRRHLKQ